MIHDPMSPEFQQLLGRAFSPTAPIDERSLFSGRLDQIATLLRTVSQKGQHAILFGERGVGKTSLANVLSEFLGTATSPRINCDGLDTFETVWRKVFEEVTLENPAGGIGFFPNPTRSSAAGLLQDPVTPEGVRRALAVVAQATVPVVIIDEFDRLNQPVKRQIADTIKTLSDHAVEVTVVLVGVADSVNELIEEHESVERALVQVRMPRMTDSEIGTIIDKGTQVLAMTVEQAAKSQIVTLSQGLPHYAHLLGLHACDATVYGERDRVTSRDVERAIRVALDGAQQSIKTAWHTATSSPRKDNLFAEVLIACALADTDDLGYFAAQDVREPLRRVLGRQIEIANYAQHLADFCSEKRGRILQRTGSSRRYRFRFVNPLFQPFVVMQGFASQKIPTEPS